MPQSHDIIGRRWSLVWPTTNSPTRRHTQVKPHGRNVTQSNLHKVDTEQYQVLSCLHCLDGSLG